MVNKLRNTILELIDDCRIIYKLLYITPKINKRNLDYDAYWQKKRENHSLGVAGSFQKIRANWILDRIRTNTSVAEFGCGDAATLIWLKNKINIKPIGIDISDHILKFVKSQNIEIHQIRANEVDFESLPNADVYLLLEVLEHLPNPEEVLSKLIEKTKEKIFISIPNTGYFPYRLRLLFGRFPVQWKLNPSEHLRFWTIKDFKWWTKELGLFDQCEIKAYKGIPVLNKILPNLFGMGIICEIKL